MNDGTWLALIAAGGLAVAGAARRGSRATRLHPKRLDLLTQEQLTAMETVHQTPGVFPTPTRQQAIRAQAMLQQRGVDPFDHEYGDVVSQRERRQHSWLRQRFGANLGGGADWSVSAWQIDSHDNHQGYRGHRYVVEDDDGSWAVVRRHSPYLQQDHPLYQQNDEIEDIVNFGENFGKLQRWIALNVQR